MHPACFTLPGDQMTGAQTTGAQTTGAQTTGAAQQPGESTPRHTLPTTAISRQDHKAAEILVGEFNVLWLDTWFLV